MKKLVTLLLLPVLLLGCGQTSPQGLQKETLLSAAAPTSAPVGKSFREPVDEQEGPATKQASTQSPAGPVPRKIVYTAGIDLLVPDLSEARTKLDAVMKQFHGLLAQSAITSNPGEPRSANWRVRVPVDSFTDFVNQVAGLGEATRNTTDSDDITDRYYDFQVRMQNKQIQLERLQKIIKEQTGKISEILEAERELGRVTTELEELKGTLKVWENQTALATVNITIRERTRYVAPIVPSFAGNATETFSSSVHALVTFGQNLALVAVALTPWLPLLVIAALFARFVLRRTWQRTAAPMQGK